MSNSSGRKIRIDQSHCNYVLSKALAALEWEVLFRDPGRATRGASGNQAAILGVFERHGLPLPDIAALKDGKLLLIEVDHSAQSNQASFQAYRTHEQLILREVSSVLGLDPPCAILLVGFCRIGAQKGLTGLLTSLELDLVAQFNDAHTPELNWAPPR